MNFLTESVMYSIFCVSHLDFAKVNCIWFVRTPTWSELSAVLAGTDRHPRGKPPAASLAPQVAELTRRFSPHRRLPALF
jgi:hypothetical protein